MQAVRLDDGAGTTYLLANTHCTSYPPDERLPDAELLRAAWFASSLARPEDVVILAGDFNVRAERSRTLRDLTGPEWGFSRARSRHRPRARSRRAVLGGAPLARRATRARRPAPVGSCARGGRHRMNWVDERARFPVFERFAYFNAGTNGPLSRQTLDAMADLRSWEATHGRAGKAYFDAMIARSERVRALFAEQLGVPVENVALTESTTQGVHVVVTGLALGPSDEVVTTDAEHFGLSGPLFASRRVAPNRTGARRAGGGCLRARAPGGDAADQADRDLGRVLVRREGVPVAGAAASDRSAGPRRRCSVRRCDRRRRCGGGLLHRQRPEVAVRAGFDGSALRARPRAAAAATRRLPGAGRLRHRRGDVGAKAGGGALRYRLPPAVVLGRARGSTLRAACRTIRSRRRADRVLPFRARRCRPRCRDRGGPGDAPVVSRTAAMLPRRRPRSTHAESACATSRAPLCCVRRSAGGTTSRTSTGSWWS